MHCKRILLCAALALAAGQAHAEDCQLKQYASLDLIADDNRVLVPVTLGGQPGGYFELDFSAPVSGIADAASDALHLKRSFVKSNVHINIDGADVREQVFAPTQLGAVKGDIVMGVIPGFHRDDARIVGVLGTDLLGKFDVDLDIAHQKLNLFSPDHCKGQVVYWTHTAAVAAVPLVTKGLETFAIPMQLDGKDIEATFSASAKPLLNSRIAHDTYGIDTTPDADGIIPRHKFKTLAVDGLAITNPEFAIYKDDSGGCNGGYRTVPPALGSNNGTHLEQCFGLPDLMIGIPELKRLHVYIAFREHMVYITAANAS